MSNTIISYSLYHFMKAGDLIKKTYTTSEVAKTIGVHPNTVRLYEEIEFIPKSARKENGYRMFTDMHLDHLRLVRTGLQIPIVQNGLRKKVIEVITVSAKGEYNTAIILTKEYIAMIEKEIANGNEAVKSVKELLHGEKEDGTVSLKRKEVSEMLGITMDTLRNWEMNGLLSIKRKENGYRVYNNEDLNKIKIIRSLRCANYSLSSILRLMNTLSHNEDTDITFVLNTPEDEEDIISVCDTLIVSLHAAKENAEKILDLLEGMKINYSNPPL